jgi:hypothetical protein
MIVMRFIKADRRVAELIQERFSLSNYQMIYLSWAIGLLMGFAIAANLL